MRKRPISLNVLIMVLVGVALSFPIQAAVLYGHGITELSSIFHKITILNLFVMILCIVNVPFLLQGSRMMVPALLMALAVVSYNNYVVGSFGLNFSMNTTALASLCFFLLNGFFLDPKVIKVLRDPKKRWWLQSPRKEVSIPLSMNVIRGESYNLKSYNISETGVFIPLDEELLDNERVIEGDIVDIQFALGPLRQVKCQAKVIRSCQKMEKFPSGVGVHFTDMKTPDRRALKKYIESNHA